MTEKFWDYMLRLNARHFASDERAATAIEYGLIAAGVAVAIVTVVNQLGTKLATTFTNVTTQMK